MWLTASELYGEVKWLERKASRIFVFWYVPCPFFLFCVAYEYAYTIMAVFRLPPTANEVG